MSCRLRWGASGGAVRRAGHGLLPPAPSPLPPPLLMHPTPLSPARRIYLASHAVELLQWSSFPQLATVRLQVRGRGRGQGCRSRCSGAAGAVAGLLWPLPPPRQPVGWHTRRQHPCPAPPHPPPHLMHPPPQCPNLRELDLSECRALKDAVFESLGSGQSPPGYLGGDLNPGGWVVAVAAAVSSGMLSRQACQDAAPAPAVGRLISSHPPWPRPTPAGCPQLRVLKLGDCEALRTCSLASTCLESLHLSQCRWLESVRLDCPMLTQVGVAGWPVVSGAGVWSGGAPHREQVQLHVARRG